MLQEQQQTWKRVADAERYKLGRYGRFRMVVKDWATDSCRNASAATVRVLNSMSTSFVPLIHVFRAPDPLQNPPCLRRTRSQSGPCMVCAAWLSKSVREVEEKGLTV